MRHRIRQVLWAGGILGLVWAGLIAPERSLAQSQSSGETAQLRELAERLLESPYGYVTPSPFSSVTTTQPPSLELLVGQLPADPALDIPVPAGGRLVGSAVRHGPGLQGPGAGAAVQVVIDAPGSPTEVAAFYAQALADRGWTTGSSYGGSHMGGFQQPPVTSSAYFCRDDGQGAFYIQAQPRAGRQGLTDVRVSFMENTPACSTPSVSPYSEPPSMSPYQSLPALYPPDGVTIRQNGGYGGGNGSYAMEARATATMSAADLETFFARQLADNGWTRASGAASGGVAWSSWSVPDMEDVQGFLSVRELPGGDQRVLTVRIDSLVDQSGGPGSAGYYYNSYPSYMPSTTVLTPKLPTPPTTGDDAQP